jgi:hypothetical protein
LVKNIEFYKLEYGHYPNNLQKLLIASLMGANLSSSPFTNPKLSFVYHVDINFVSTYFRTRHLYIQKRGRFATAPF